MLVRKNSRKVLGFVVRSLQWPHNVKVRVVKGISKTLEQATTDAAYALTSPQTLVIIIGVAAVILVVPAMVLFPIEDRCPKCYQKSALEPTGIIRNDDSPRQSPVSRPPKIQ